MLKFKSDASFAKITLPIRKKDGNKGTFGRVFAIIGSKKYPGASHLAIESILRGGAGYTELASEKEILQSVLQKFPEVIFDEIASGGKISEDDIAFCAERSKIASVTLIGSGSGISNELANLTEALIFTDTASPLIIDADAINSLAAYKNANLLTFAKRPIILTPHHMELSRLIGKPIIEIENMREKTAFDFASIYRCTIILKGFNTIISDGEKIIINTTGSSALAKGGSGDALAGLLASLISASGSRLPESITNICALACYVHGKAGDILENELSSYGVTPSDTIAYQQTAFGLPTHQTTNISGSRQF